MRTFGYARVSTDDQDLTLQVQALERYGVDYMYSEHASGKNMERKELKRVVKVMRRGDKLVVWKLDRLGRTLTGVLEMIETLNKEGIEFVSLTESFDTSSPMGKAFLQIALVFAELERNMISERTKAGMAVGRAQGKVYGRRHSIVHVPERLAKLNEMHAKGELVSPDGQMLLKAHELRDILNGVKCKADPINNDETVRRWWREGMLGLDETGLNKSEAD